MTVELFRAEPYCASFEAQITKIGDGYVTLDKSCFFPCSPVQASDLGTIEDATVRGVQRFDDGIGHLVDSAVLDTFAVGDLILANLDWDRRYRTMRLHTAQHLVEAAYGSLHDSGTAIRSSVDARRARVDIVDRSPEDRLELSAITRWVKSSVVHSLPCVYRSDGGVEPRWFWYVDGLLTSACDGTHVRSTAEVGDVEINVVELTSTTTGIEIQLLD